MLKTNLSFSLKYFFSLTPIAALLLTLVTIVPYVPKVESQINQLMDQSRNLYPEDLIITANEGNISINKPEPYIVPTPKGLFEEGGEDVPANLIVFDSDGTLDDIETYDTWVLINSRNALVKSTNKVEVSPLSELPNGEFSKEDFEKVLSQARSIANIIPIIMVLGGFLGILLYYIIFRMLYLVFVGLTLWPVGAIRGAKYPFHSYFKIAIHTFTFPLIAELIVAALDFQIGVGFWIFAMNWIFGALVIWYLTKKIDPATSEVSDIDEPTPQEPSQIE